MKRDDLNIGNLIKSLTDDAVRAGRLSGSAAVAGLKALGLDGAAPQPNADDAPVDLDGMTPDQQREAIDRLVRTGKLSGSDAVAKLRALGLEG